MNANDGKNSDSLNRSAFRLMLKITIHMTNWAIYWPI